MKFSRSYMAEILKHWLHNMKTLGVVCAASVADHEIGPFSMVARLFHSDLSRVPWKMDGKRLASAYFTLQKPW